MGELSARTTAGSGQGRSFRAPVARGLLVLGVAGIVVLSGVLHMEGIPRPLEFAGDLAFATVAAIGAFIGAWYLPAARDRVHRAHLSELQELACRDELSGLYNYRYLREALRTELAEAERQDTPCAVIMFDLNDFKDVNDRFGHQAGDAVVVAIAQAMRDEVSGRGVVARYGGDEFTVLLPDTDRRGAESLAIDVSNAIAYASISTTPLNHHSPVTASYGIAVYPRDALDAEALIAQADRALYEAKAQMSTLRARTEERHAQDVFFAIGEAIGASLDPKRLVHNLVNAVGATLDLDSCTIWLVQGNGDLAARAYYVADADLFERVRRAQTSHPMTREEAAAAGMLGARPAYFDDVATAAAFPERFRAALDPGTWVVSVPLPAPREGMFILAATHARSAPPSTSLANAIARLASAAIRNADAYAREKHRVEQLSALAGIGGFLFGEGDFEERLGAIVRKIVDVTGYDMVTLDALDPTGSRPFYRHFYGRMPDGSEFDDGFVELWRGLRPTLSEPDIVRFLETLDGPIMMTDPLREVPEMYREIIVNSNTRSVVVLPVNWQGEMKALMYFASFRENAFDEHDVALMQTIAAQIGPAVQVATLNTQLELSYSELKEAHREAIQRLAYAAEARDPYTGRHLQRIGVLSQALARRMGFDDDGVEAIGYAAVVHDIGKLRIPDSILMKPSALSEEDWRVMRRHPEFGAELLGTGRFYDAAREVALHHHERWDGSGYPFGLVGEEIPLAARIVSVADVYDALISARPYKLAWSAERALAELVQMRGRTLCPATVGSFLQLWSEGEVARIEAETQDASFEADFRERFAA